jgi:hypothetical protein
MNDIQKAAEEYRKNVKEAETDRILEAWIEKAHRAGAKWERSRHAWVKCSERLPNVGEPVLVIGIKESELSQDRYDPSIGLVVWEDVNCSNCQDTCYYDMWYTNITHWMSLPPLPDNFPNE